VDLTTGQALEAIHPDTGRDVEYPALLRSSEGAALWEESCAEEAGRLANGYKQSKGTNTIKFIRHDQVPKGRKATYLRNVVTDRPQKTQTCRVRWTVGGNLINYPGDVSTKTAGLTTAKLLFNSVISTPNALFMSMDIKDFYLNTILNRPEYMMIPFSLIPQAIFDQYDLGPLVHNGYVYVEINKGMYGLPQAGKIAKYKMTTDWNGNLYCGITLNWDYTNRTVELSMPGYMLLKPYNVSKSPLQPVPNMLLPLSLNLSMADKFN
jgi:hypothetical protein